MENTDGNRNISTSLDAGEVPFILIQNNKFQLFLVWKYVDHLTFYKNATAEGPPPVNQIIIQSPPATASRVAGNLWQGSAPPIGSQVAKYFDCLVLSAVEYQLGPDCFPGVELIQVGLHDHGTPITWEEMQLAVRTAGHVIRRLNQGKKILVTCHQGLNRSGLICALSLCCGPPKMHPDQAIALIRAARGPIAMGNKSFRNFLKAYCSGQVPTPKL